MKEVIDRRGQEVGVPDIYDKIATEEDDTPEEEVVAFMEKRNNFV